MKISSGHSPMFCVEIKVCARAYLTVDRNLKTHLQFTFPSASIPNTGDSRQFASCGLKAVNLSAIYFLFLSPTSSILRPTSDLWLANYRRYSIMASSRDDSNQVGGNKGFRHAVDSSGER